MILALLKFVQPRDDLVPLIDLAYMSGYAETLAPPIIDHKRIIMDDGLLPDASSLVLKKSEKVFVLMG